MSNKRQVRTVAGADHTDKKFAFCGKSFFVQLVLRMRPQHGYGGVCATRG
jgi:hypothetical protein